MFFLSISNPSTSQFSTHISPISLHLESYVPYFYLSLVSPRFIQSLSISTSPSLCSVHISLIPPYFSQSLISPFFQLPFFFSLHNPNLDFIFFFPQLPLNCSFGPNPKFSGGVGDPIFLFWVANLTNPDFHVGPKNCFNLIHVHLKTILERCVFYSNGVSKYSRIY